MMTMTRAELLTTIREAVEHVKSLTPDERYELRRSGVLDRRVDIETGCFMDEWVIPVR